MSEYIIRVPDDALFVKIQGIEGTTVAGYAMTGEVVRCRDCSFAYRVFWPEPCDIPEEFLNCHGPLVAHWDYEHDEPAKNPVEPDGFCAWGERRKQ